MSMLASLTWIYAVVNYREITEFLQPLFLYLAWYLFDICCYTITSTTTCNIINHKCKTDWSLEKDEDNRPCGLIVHRHYPPKYIIYRPRYDATMYVYTTRRYFTQTLNICNSVATKDTNESKTGDDTDELGGMITIYFRKGDQGYSGYRTRTVAIPNYRMTFCQVTMYHEIQQFYKTNKFAKVLISGPMHSGKTCFAYLLARELRTSLVTTFNPTEPSDSLDNLYHTVDHSSHSPLIILLDEVDTMFDTIVRGIPRHKKYLIQVRTKQHWNIMMDQIELGIYPHIILIMTTNKSKDELGTKYDTSLTRPGRVNLFYWKTKTIL